jgi:hypothetical protein
MTITEAIQQRIPRVHKAIWANPDAYLRLPLFAEGAGPWAELYDEIVQLKVLDIRPGSQRVCVIGQLAEAEDDWEAYRGAVSEYEKDPKNFAKNYVEA